MKNTKTEAAIIACGYLVGYTTTSLKNGDRCDYGYEIDGGRSIRKIGAGKISRAKKWFADDLRYLDKPSFDVNRGGGSAE